MITILNRKVLLSTFDMKTQAEVRTVLADNKIDYIVKVINRNGAMLFGGALRGRMGTFGENIQLMYEYVIYVKKVDFDKARFLMSEIK